MKKYVLFFVGAVLLSMNASAEKIYHCVDSNGKKIFQGTPCEASTTLKVQEVRQNASAAAAKKNNSANAFYGIPVHSSASKKEVVDDPSIGVASLRCISNISMAEMLIFYRESIPIKHKEDGIQGTVILSYKVGDFNKMITIVDYFGKADVTVQSEK